MSEDDGIAVLIERRICGDKGISRNSDSVRYNPSIQTMRGEFLEAESTGSQDLGRHMSANHFPFVNSTIFDYTSEDAEEGRNRASHRRQTEDSRCCIWDSSQFPTNSAKTLAACPPEVPPQLLQPSEFKSLVTGRKVRVIVCVSPDDSAESESFLRADAERSRVTLLEPSQGELWQGSRQSCRPIQKSFVFDAVFPQNTPLSAVCSASLVETLHSVVNGSDGCIFTYGHGRVGKTFTMFGAEDVDGSVGILPSAIAWLSRMIGIQMERTGSRFSIRVSAAQLIDRNGELKDLLTHLDSGKDGNHGVSSTTDKREQTESSRHLLRNLTQLKTTSADHLTYCLDAAVSSLNSASDDDRFTSHFLFTISIYHYRMDNNSSAHGSAGGRRSRLHFLDLGRCSMATSNPASSSLSVSAVGDVVMAILSGQHHVPYGQWKLTQLLKECLELRDCHSTCMVACVSSAWSCYKETLEVLGSAANILRMNDHLKKSQPQRCRHSHQTDDESHRSLPRTRSRMFRGIRMGLRGGELTRTKGSYSDTEQYASESEQSGTETVCLGKDIRCSVTGKEKADVRRRFDRSRNVCVAFTSGFGDYDRLKISCPEKASECCLQRQPLDFKGANNRCRLGEMSGADNRFCRVVYAPSCEVESEASSFERRVRARRADGYSSIGVDGGNNSRSCCGRSREGLVRFQGDMGCFGATQNRSVIGSSVVCDHPRFGKILVDGSPCEPWLCREKTRVAVSNCPNATQIQDKEERGTRYRERGNWTSMLPSSAYERLDRVRSTVGNRTYLVPQAPSEFCCYHEPCLPSEGVLGASSYHINDVNRRTVYTSRLDETDERAVLCRGKQRPCGVRTLSPSSRKSDRCRVSPSSLTEICSGSLCYPIRSRCKGSLARPIATRPAKSATDRTASWVKAVQGYCSPNEMVQSHQVSSAVESNSCPHELLFPHLTLSESLAIRFPSTGVASDDSLPSYENISGRNVESEELFLPIRSSKTEDEKLWYTAEKLTELGFEVFPKRKRNDLAVTPGSQRSTYDEDLEKELDSLCNNVSSLKIDDSASSSSQSIQVHADTVKGEFQNIQNYISTASDTKSFDNNCNIPSPSETPTVISEKENVSKCDSLSQRSLARPDRSWNPTIFEKSQNSPHGKTDTSGEKSSSVQCRVERTSLDEESFDRSVDVVKCLLPVQKFGRSRSCDVESTQRLEILNVLKAHGDAVACFVTDESLGDVRETDRNSLNVDCGRVERKGRQRHDPTLKVPASVEKRRSTSSLINALSSALRCSNRAEKSKPATSGRCHSSEPYLSGDKEVIVPAVRKGKGQTRLGKSNRAKVDTQRKAVDNCDIPLSSAIPVTVAVSSGHKSMICRVEDLTQSRQLAQNVCSDSKSEDSNRRESSGRCTDGKVPLGIDDFRLDNSSKGDQTNIQKRSREAAGTVCPLRPLPISTYSSEEVERMEKWSRSRRIRLKESSQDRDELKIRLIKRRDKLQQELLAARKLLNTNDCQSLAFRRNGVDSCSTGQLEKEIGYLEELVAEFKQRIMMVTCFDRF